MAGRESRGHSAGHGQAWTPADGQAAASVRGDPVAVRHGLMAYVSATRHARRMRSLVIAMSLFSAVVMLTAASGWLLTSSVTSGLARVTARTADVPVGGPLNIRPPELTSRHGQPQRPG